jgi:hypothetical protein
VDLPNSIDGAPGDNIQVPVAWQYPDSLELVTPSDVYWMRDFCREKPRPVAPRSPDWLGYALIDRLHLARENEAHRDSGLATVCTYDDLKSNIQVL